MEQCRWAYDRPQITQRRMLQFGQGRSNGQWESMGLVRNTSKTAGGQGEERHKVLDFTYEIRTKATMTFC